MSEPDLRPPTSPQRTRDSSTTKWLLLVLAIAAIGYGGWYAREYWAAQNRATPPEAVAPAAPAPEAALPAVEPEPSAPPVVPPPAAEGAPQHPLPESTADTLPADDALALDRWVGQWLSSQAQKFVVTPGVAHHIVATIDNLPRSHAAPRLWPIYPVGGKMELAPPTQSGGQGMQIATSNSARYDGVVGFVTSLEPAQVAQWYRQAYPVLQQSYENLGYPGKYFNDRLVAVIDHLLATPEPQAPLAVQLVQVQTPEAGQAPNPPQQPWLRYEFVDARLQALSAGQKILLRIGAEHRLVIKAYLQALRAQITV